jgi:hypothetical protein
MPGNDLAKDFIKADSDIPVGAFTVLVDAPST